MVQMGNKGGGGGEYGQLEKQITRFEQRPVFSFLMSFVVEKA